MKKQLTILALALLPLGVWAQSSDSDFFGDEAAPTVTPGTTTSVDPTKQFSETAEGVRWGGTVKSTATWQPAVVGAWPGDSSASYKDSLAYALSTKLFVDGRPDKDFRFRLSLKTGYPFTNDTENVQIGTTTTKTTTLSTPNIQVWELFTDVTVGDTVFLRFGKQSASWGVSYFYSPGDVISLTGKDVTDPTAEREGPMALKATIPFPAAKASVTGFVLARDSYFAGTTPALKNLGYALQGDILVADAQLTLGGFFQEATAPKAVATINTGLGSLGLPVLSDVNLFSEAVFSYGSDVLKGSGSTGGSTPYYTSVTTWDKQVYYTGTVGASYTNNDGNWTLRSEYLFNPFGSNDKDAAARAFNTYGVSLAGIYGLYGSNTAGRTLALGDITTPGMHNLTNLLSLSKLGGNDRLAFATLWQQNLSDGSGWVKPYFTFDPIDQLTFTWGLTVVYGDTNGQYPLTFQYYDASGIAQGVERVILNVGVTFGTGKY